MGFISILLGGDEWREKPKEEKQADIGRHRATRKALNDNSERERRRGIRDETVTYYQLNDAVHESEQHVPWWRR